MAKESKAYIAARELVKARMDKGERVLDIIASLVEDASISGKKAEFIALALAELSSEEEQSEIRAGLVKLLRPHVGAGRAEPGIFGPH
ncbi:MAG: hypothetical protein ABIK36_16310 [Pseudomonadota bacterium]